MHILLCGDVVGRAGREAVKAYLPRLKRDLAIDLAIVNAENAAAGFGLTERIAGEWWRESAPFRDYYRIEDLEGRRFWLYREGPHGTGPRWFLHGLFP